MTVAAWIAAGLVGLVVASIAVAQPAARPGNSSPSSSTYRGSVGTASGGAAAGVVYPGVVDVRFRRSKAAVSRAETAADTARRALAATQLSVATSQMNEAWRATRWLIKTTPPPPPPVDDRAGAGGASGGAGFAAPPQTSLGLFGLQHDLVAASAGLLGLDPALDTSAVTTIQTTAKMRLTAVRWIHNKVPPTPPPADRAGASGAAVAATFDSVMPSVLPLLDDEITALRGVLQLQRNVPLSDAVVTSVRAAIDKDKTTMGRINAFWPPVVGDD